MPHLQTPRLNLVPFSAEILKAALRDRAEVGRLLSVNVPEEWPEPDFAEIIPYLVASLEDDLALGEWGAFLLHAADRTLIGAAGFRARPDSSGTVEIGYGIVPSYRRRGLAFEAVQALIGWAMAQEGVRRVIAGCQESNVPSQRILEKLDMHPIRREADMVMWELNAPGR